MRDNDYAAFHADRLALEERIDDILALAAHRPLTFEELRELRAACGIPERKTNPKVTYDWEGKWH